MLRALRQTSAALVAALAMLTGSVAAQSPTEQAAEAVAAAARNLVSSSPDEPTASANAAAPTAAAPVASKVEDDLAQPLKLVLVLTILALAPAILMTATSFTRILIVMSFVRKAIAIPELPPNQVLIGLSLFLTCVVMKPVMDEVNEQALRPYLAETITIRVAGERTAEALKRFMLAHVRTEDVTLFLELSETEAPEKPEDIPLMSLVPAFALSEIRTAFQMGFLVYLPFLILDLVVSSILLSMGMFMLPPVVVSTPFKILLFVLTDGWELVVSSIVKSFQAGGGA